MSEAKAYDPARLDRARRRAIKRLGPGQYAVAGNEQPIYYVDLNVDPPCYCKDREMRPDVHCLHELAARLQERDPALLMALGERLLRSQRMLAEYLGEEEGG